MARKLSTSSFVLLLGNLILFTGLAKASAPDPASYPLRVQVMRANWHHTAWGTTGYGKANLQQNDQVQGLDYTFECPEPFLPSDGGDRYMAKWKNVGSKLAILTHPVGNPNKHSECDLKVEIHPYAFKIMNGQLVTVTAQQMNQQKDAHVVMQQAPSPIDTDPAHYPLKVTMLSVEWGPKTASGYLGAGKGNVRDGDKINAVDFSAKCPAKLLPTVEGHHLKGVWDIPNAKILVITHRVGDVSIVHQCQFDVTVKPDVYIKQPSGAIAAITQTEYFAQLAQQATDTDSPQ
jgi:hypothetical protein